MNRFVLAPRARYDLLEIWQYIAADNVGAADRTIRRIEDCVRLLGNNPKMGESRPDLGAEIRSFSVGNYVILFRRAAEHSQILRIVHGSRDLGAIET